MQVLHVVAPGEAGGLERVVQGLAAGQRARGDTVHVAAVAAAGDEGDAKAFLAPLRAAGVVTHVLELPPRRYLRERAAVTALCEKLRPAVVHTHGYRADLVDSPAAHRVGAAAVSTLHGFTHGSARNRCYEWLQRMAFRRFDAVVAVSRPLALQLVDAGIPAARVHLVQNRLPPGAPAVARADAREALGIDRDSFALGWVGRISREKGLDVMIDAMALLHDVPIQLCVVGDGPERTAMEARAQRAGVAERITWHGFVPQAGTLLTAFDALVLSSRTEGTPIVLLEALAAGVPVVASRVGGVPDMMREEDGRLVEPCRADALAQAIRDVFDRPGVALARARAARDRATASGHTAEWVEQYDAVYRTAFSTVPIP